MLKVRTTKTASKNTAVQVVLRSKKKTTVVKHIGTAKSPEELNQLLELARQYVYKKNNTAPLFPEFLGADKQRHFVAIENLKFLNACHKFAYEFLSYFYELNNFVALKNNLLKDLAIIRIIEPASKIRSIELLKKYFGIKYSRNSVYRGLLRIKKLKDGYPIAIDTFAGNKFEGHTLIPVIKKFKETYNIENLTIVADAAMLSRNNIQELILKAQKQIANPGKMIKRLRFVKETTKSTYKHILIVFLSLCVTKSIEMLTGLSIKRVRDLIWSVLDIEFVDILTNKRFFRRMEAPNNEMVEFLMQRK